MLISNDIVQLIVYNLRLPPRRPPNLIIEQLKQINKEYHLGHILCSCRDPGIFLQVLILFKKFE
jgi:integrator complex subunit 1